MRRRHPTLLQVLIWNCRFASIIFSVLFGFSVLLQAKESPDLSVRFSFTCDGDVKLNRYFTIEAVMGNKGTDFSGKLQVIFPKQKDSDPIALEKPISVKAGNEVSEKIMVYLDSKIPYIEVRVIDLNGKIRIAHQKELAFSGKSDTLYVGSFSNHPDSLRYLGESNQASRNAKIFSLGEQIPPEEVKEYDMYDVILVNDFDMNRFSRKQMDALRSWIENGGSFILGADSYLEANLALFADEMTVNKIGRSRRSATDLGLFPEDLEQIRDNVSEFSLSPRYVERREISIEGSCILQADDEGILFQEISYGKGVLQVSGMNLALYPSNRNGIGTAILHMIYNNVSNNKAVQMNRESYNRMYDPIYRSIDFKEKRTNYPVAGYIIVYSVYIFILGPILYYVLKKKDRRELYWIFAPAVSVIVTVIIVIMGSSTRIADQYIGYFSMLTMEETGKGNLETLFMVESAEHKKYRIITHKDAEIMPVLNYSDIETGENKKVSEKYKLLLTMEEDQTICNMNGYASFETAYFRSNQALMSANSDKKYYHTDVDYEHGRLEGTVTVNLGYDLENACILNGNMVTAIGTIKNGIPTKIQNQKSQPLSSQSDLYSPQTRVSSILQDVTGYEMKSPLQTDEEYQNYGRYQLLSYYLEQNLHTSGSYIIGFSEKPMNYTVKNQDIPMNGEIIVILPLSLNGAWENRGGVMSLDSYKTIRKGSWQLENRTIKSNSLHVMYAVPGNIQINEIQYSKQYNGEFNSQEENGYFGKILLYNNRTQIYDEVFVGQAEGTLTDMDDYVNDYNQIRVLYQKDANKSSVLPTLSATVDGRIMKDADN